MTLEVIIDCFCLSILVVVLIGTLIQKDKRDKSSKRFCVLIYSVIAFVLLDIFSELFDGKPEHTISIYVINLLCFFDIDAIFVAFTFYISALIGVVNLRHKILFNMVGILTFARIALIILLFTQGKLFTIENGWYVDGDGSIIPYTIAAFVIFILHIITIAHRSRFDTLQFIAITAYMIIPVVAITIEYFTLIYSLTPMSLTFSVMMIYSLIQAVAIEQGKIRESVLEEISNTDLLTNMKNRRAFYNFIASITPEQNVGVIFCDMNKLKYTNDNLGHTEGDKLIKEFADMLVSSFRNDDVFRISGDEFVCVVPNISAECFFSRASDFKHSLENRDDIAAMGCTYGTGEKLNSLISDAESKMYEDKRICHERFEKKLSAIPEIV